MECMAYFITSISRFQEVEEVRGWLGPLEFAAHFQIWCAVKH